MNFIDIHKEYGHIEIIQERCSRRGADASSPGPAWYLPTVADLLFLVVVFQSIQLGQTALLNDPGTPWHVRVGTDVIRTGPPHVDTYSFTRTGERWISQHWLCDVVFALLYQSASWDGLVIAAALVLGWTYRALYRTALDARANIVWAALLTLLAAGCAAPHWLVRPHLVSIGFLLLTFRWCLSYHRSGSLWLWALPFLMALWCNLHGGFLAGLVVIGCSLIGQMLSKEPSTQGAAFRDSVVPPLQGSETVFPDYEAFERGQTVSSLQGGIIFSGSFQEGAGGSCDAWRGSGRLFEAAFGMVRGRVWRNRVVGFALVLAASILATMANPYGWKLHAHLGNILFSSQVRDLIDEWGAPNFQGRECLPLETLLLLSIFLLALAKRRLDSFSLLHLVVWVHFGLLAVRQVAFLGVVAAPLLAGLTGSLASGLRDRFGSGRWLRWMEEIGRRADSWAVAERLARFPLWSVVLTVALGLATVLGAKLPVLGIGTARPSSVRWPIAAVKRLAHEPATGPLFHDLNWGGYLILMAQPPRLVFADDRFELYGRPFLLEYLDALNGGPGWSALWERYGFQFVLIRPDVPLARLLGDSADWEVLHKDRTSILLRRRTSPHKPEA